VLPSLALVLLLVASAPAAAQPRPFSCVGAERLEDDVFAVPFSRNSVVPGEDARSPIAAAAELARAQPERMICVLGLAGEEAGAATGQRRAAERARAVALHLAELGVERDRIRAEARRASFSPRARQAAGTARGALIVVLPEAP